ncbi:hypothetical protein [Amycolatopsis sp. EV170708-02-1]|uniref:hypothetical protein n=1 Tax=Amycolatopsis sp. EV170708-02-1 TaxID=2919322 RepID=UPI001F0C4037|nr:hypothetical protein [Amycolatopsis sp. EV170708-02-1]UMP01305.1 hypothetical protein MJQ72_33440 [Amycolatopsis sp. EV170708-02-1]
MKLLRALAVCLLLAGCGVRPDGPLYFVDAQQRLRPDERKSGRLGSIADALALLFSGAAPGQGLHTEIAPSALPRVTVTTELELVQLTLPLARREVSPLGIDQIVCTALGVHVQGGGARTAKVRLGFTIGDHRPRRSDTS